MAGALLYQPTQRWRIGAAFGAAALIHFAAVVLADRDHQTQVEATPPSQDGGIPIDFLAPDAPTEESTPPPEDVATPAPVPVPVEDQIFVENRTTPSPVRRQPSERVAPIVKVRSGVISGTVDFSSIRAMALSGPRPAYPYEARRQKITGSGIAMMTVDPAGNVFDVVMQESTGSPVLDNSAIAAFRRWRFKPGTGPKVRSPITFTLTGAQY